MKLATYPGFLGQWPPPAHSAASEPVALEHCRDTLISAFRIVTRPRERVFRIDILTTFEGVLYMREIVNAEDILSGIVCAFLNKQRGKTIRDIGEMDVSFLV